MCKRLKIFFSKSWQNLNKEDNYVFKFGIIAILIVGAASIIIMPLVLTLKWFYIVDFTKTGGIGDTINGIASPFLTLLVACLTYAAFFIQYKANILQQKQFKETLERQDLDKKDQDKIWITERFETKFYELLRLHKENVNEMNIADKIKGRKCFVSMFYELRYCYRLVEETYRLKQIETQFGYVDIMGFVYNIFFYGVGENSERNYSNNFNRAEKELFTHSLIWINDIQHECKSSSSYPCKIDKFGGITFDYYPFDGHVNRLAHYFRHLFQTMEFISNHDTIKVVYPYVKLLRAQLSDFEQLMLYYNALAWFDEEWKVFFTDYRLIKNIPIPLADFDKRPLDHFSNELESLKEKGIYMFEFGNVNRSSQAKRVHTI